jgi:hypothetical protein
VTERFAAYPPVVQLPRDPSNVAPALTAAFPTRFAGDVRTVLAVMPEARHAPMMPFEVEVQGETVAIPSRIYNDEPGVGSDGQLSGTQQLTLPCLYSRHHDGRSASGTLSGSWRRTSHGWSRS